MGVTEIKHAKAINFEYSQIIIQTPSLTISYYYLPNSNMDNIEGNMLKLTRLTSRLELSGDKFN